MICNVRWLTYNDKAVSRVPIQRRWRNTYFLERNKNVNTKWLTPLNRSAVMIVPKKALKIRLSLCTLILLSVRHACHIARTSFRTRVISHMERDI